MYMYVTTLCTLHVYMYVYGYMNVRVCIHVASYIARITPCFAACGVTGRVMHRDRGRIRSQKFPVLGRTVVYPFWWAGCSWSVPLAEITRQVGYTSV